MYPKCEICNNKTARKIQIISMHTSDVLSTHFLCDECIYKFELILEDIKTDVGCD